MKRVEVVAKVGDVHSSEVEVKVTAFKLNSPR